MSVDLNYHQYHLAELTEAGPLILHVRLAQQPNHQKTERATVPIQPTGVYSTLDERPPYKISTAYIIPVQQPVQPA